jgi:hypothetical protein
MYKCLNCKIETSTTCQKTNKYCSNRCQFDYQYKIRIEEWLKTGIVDRSGTPPWLKKYILEKQGGKCESCGISSWNNKPIVFDLEHKDGNNRNNLENNLCCICPNCHSQTDTYKGKNRGNGRHSRRERYNDGKSF